VDALEDLLYAYRDDKYTDEIDKIDDECKLTFTKKNSQENMRHAINNASQLKTTLKYRALMGLAFRKNFTPAKSSNKDGVI